MSSTVQGCTETEIECGAIFPPNFYIHPLMPCRILFPGKKTQGYAKKAPPKPKKKATQSKENRHKARTYSGGKPEVFYANVPNEAPEFSFHTQRFPRDFYFIAQGAEDYGNGAYTRWHHNRPRPGLFQGMFAPPASSSPGQWQTDAAGSTASCHRGYERAVGEGALAMRVPQGFTAEVVSSCRLIRHMQTWIRNLAHRHSQMENVQVTFMSLLILLVRICMRTWNAWAEYSFHRILTLWIQV